MQYQISLASGVPKRQDFIGTNTNLILLDLGVATTVDMKIEVQGFGVEELQGIKKGANIHGPVFTGTTFTAAVDCVIQVIVSNANITINQTDGANVNATIIGQPVNVVNDRGAPGTPVYVSGITYSDAPAVTLTDTAAVPVTAAGAALVAANANRRGLRFTNIGVDPVTIGFTGITWAKRCIILNSGDTWVEDRAANLAWAAICDTGKTASVTIQQVIA